MSFSLSTTILPAPSTTAPVIPGLTCDDVALGRGTRINENAGNVRFRNIIGAVFHQYRNIREGQKHLFAQEVTDLVLSQGRIVERDEAGNWRDAPYHKCKRKTQTLLRDYSLKERRRRMRSVSRPVSPLVVNSKTKPSFDNIPPLPSTPTLVPRVASLDSVDTLELEDPDQDHSIASPMLPLTVNSPAQSSFGDIHALPLSFADEDSSTPTLVPWEPSSDSMNFLSLEDLDGDPVLQRLLKDSSEGLDMLDSFVDAFSDDEGEFFL